MRLLERVACVWLGPDPSAWDLTGERAVRAASLLRNIPTAEPPEHDLQLRGAASYQRIAVDAVQQVAGSMLDELGLRAMVTEPSDEAIVAGIGVEIRTRLLQAITPEDVPEAVADDNMLGYVLQCAEVSVREQLEQSRALLDESLDF